MTSKLYLHRRGPSGGAHIDYTAFTGRKGIPFFDGQESTILMGGRMRAGEASQGTFVLMDPEAEVAATDFLFNMPPHSLVTWTEDAPGFEAWLARGRIANYEGGRGIVKVDNEVEFSATVDDCNVDLRGQAFTEAWVRPSESDYARLHALYLYTLNGASSTADNFRATTTVVVENLHLAPNTNTVTMPAKKYLPGTQPQDVITDCADTAGKQYGVVIHHTGGSHLCLFYSLDSDHATYASAAKISDHLDENDPLDPTAPIWEPHWETGRGQIHDGQQLLSGIVNLYGPENAIYEEWPDNDQDYDYWVEAYHDGRSTTQTQAESRAVGILQDRRLNQVTHSVSVIVQASQVDLIATGMSIQIKAAASIGGQYLDTWQSRRIAELFWEPRIDGTYWAHMSLDRPQRRVRMPIGNPGPQPPVSSEPAGAAISDYLWTFTSHNKDDATNTYPWGTLATNWHANYVHTHVLNPGIQTETPLPPITPGTYSVRARYGRMVGSPYNSGGVRVNVYSINTGVDTLIGSTALKSFYDGSEDTISVTVPSGGDHLLIALPYNDSMISELEVSHGSATVEFIGTPPPPAASDPEGTVGTSPIYSPSDHQHPVQIADVTPIGDAGGYFEGGNVEEALQELAVDITVTGDELVALGVVGPILIADDHSTPLVFADLLQTEEGDDLLYADIGE